MKSCSRIAEEKGNRKRREQSVSGSSEISLVISAVGPSAEARLAATVLGVKTQEPKLIHFHFDMIHTVWSVTVIDSRYQNTGNYNF